VGVRLFQRPSTPLARSGRPSGREANRLIGDLPNEKFDRHDQFDRLAGYFGGRLRQRLRATRQIHGLLVQGAEARTALQPGGQHSAVPVYDEADDLAAVQRAIAEQTAKLEWTA
jgi:hypothetical protein